MTKITYTRYPKATLKAEGHCMADRINDRDLCCAAVSMLVCTFMKRIDELKVKDKFVYMANGFAKGGFCSKGKSGRAGLEALDTVLAGFRLLKEKYPDNITIQGGK